jgi:radical SAM protein with 4Fe4S-binding SPASM domain
MDQDPPIMLSLNLRARRDSKENNRRIQQLRISPDETLSFISRDPQRYLESSLEFCSKFIGPPGDRLFSCGAGVSGGCIDAYGKFQPCMLLRHPDTVYDLRQGSLYEALTTFFPDVRKMTSRNPAYLQRCAQCFLMGLCEQCPAKSWMEHGTLDTPIEYCCEVAHAQARYLGLLNKDEHGWEVDTWRDRIERLQEVVKSSKLH